MGNCKYCGRPAGILRSKHENCEALHKRREQIIKTGHQRIISEVLRVIKSNELYDDLQLKIEEIEKFYSIPQGTRSILLVKAWEMAVDEFLEDGVLDSIEEQRLVAFKERFALSQNDLDNNGALTRTTKAAVLRDILDGVVPNRISFAGNLAINLQKNESAVWAFPGSRYLEDKVRRQYVGASRGVSIRIAKGVYYKVGQFRGQAIETTERVHIDTGLVLFTNKNIYFAGPQKSLRLPFQKIVTFEPFSDGIGVIRDTVTAKPQLFVTGDGWFTYNLAVNLSQLQ